jgi:hypothetical protein
VDAIAEWTHAADDDFAVESRIQSFGPGSMVIEIHRFIGQIGSTDRCLSSGISDPKAQLIR